MVRYWGIDLHKEYVHACEWDPVSQQKRHFRFPNTRAGWARFIDQYLGPDCRVAIEVTGNAFEVHDWLSPHVEQVQLANPNELKRLGSRRHTDRVDAERAYYNANRPRVTIDADHGFQWKATIDSNANRPRIPIQADHRFQSKATIPA